MLPKHASSSGILTLTGQSNCEPFRENDKKEEKKKKSGVGGGEFAFSGRQPRPIFLASMGYKIKGESNSPTRGPHSPVLSVRPAADGRSWTRHCSTLSATRQRRPARIHLARGTGERPRGRRTATGTQAAGGEPRAPPPGPRGRRRPRPACRGIPGPARRGRRGRDLGRVVPPPSGTPGWAEAQLSRGRNRPTPRSRSDRKARRDALCAGATCSAGRGAATWGRRWPPAPRGEGRRSAGTGPRAHHVAHPAARDPGRATRPATPRNQHAGEGERIGLPAGTPADLWPSIPPPLGLPLVGGRAVCL